MFMRRGNNQRRGRVILGVLWPHSQPCLLLLCGFDIQ
jgi:hypothetical protein